MIVLIRKQYKRVLSSVVTIQKNYRAHFWRRVFLRLRVATVILQKYRRGQLARSLCRQLREEKQKREEEERRRREEEEERRRVEEERKRMEERKQREEEERRRKEEEEEKQRLVEEELKKRAEEEELMRKEEQRLIQEKEEERILAAREDKTRYGVISFEFLGCLYLTSCLIPSYFVFRNSLVNGACQKVTLFPIQEVIHT